MCRCVEMQFLTKFTQAYPPAMCMSYAMIVKSADELWERAKAKGCQPPMLCRDMGNPMKVGPVSRRHWTTCAVDDTWEDLMPREDDESSTEESESVVASDLRSDIWEFVRDGGGAPKGLSEGEHYAWAQSCVHPGELESEAMQNVPDNFMSVVEYEIHHEPDEIDSFRADVMEEMRQFVEGTEEARLQWLQEVLLELQALNSTLHGPFFNMLVDTTDFKGSAIKKKMNEVRFPACGRHGSLYRQRRGFGHGEGRKEV